MAKRLSDLSQPSRSKRPAITQAGRMRDRVLEHDDGLPPSLASRRSYTPRLPGRQSAPPPPPSQCASHPLPASRFAYPSAAASPRSARFASPPAAGPSRPLQQPQPQLQRQRVPSPSVSGQRRIPLPPPSPSPSRGTPQPLRVARVRLSQLPPSPNQHAPAPSNGGDEEDTREPDQAVLVLHGLGAKLAAAFFDPETRRLQVLEDTKDTWGWDLAALLVEQFAPGEVLLSSSAPVEIVKLVEAYCRENATTRLVTLRHSRFAPSMSTYHLAAVRLPQAGSATAAATLTPTNASTQMSWSDSGRGGVPRNSGGRQGSNSITAGDEDDENGAGMGSLRLSMLKMGCWVNVDAPLAVAAAGALLGHLATSQAAGVWGEEARFSVDGLESLNIEDHMMINQDALTSIGVFDLESHANMHSQKHKPGHSLNGVINTTVTPLGNKLFHSWLLRPLINRARINERLNAVQLLAPRDHAQPRKDIKRHLQKIKNVFAICQKINARRASWRDWLNLVEYIEAAVAIRDALAVFALRGSLSVFKKISTALNGRVQQYLLDIVRIVDWDASREGGDGGNTHVCIRSRIDEEVDEWRENLAGLDAFLSVTGQEMCKRIHQTLCRALRVIYLPQLGHLVALHGVLNETAIPEDWEQQFLTEEAVYFKTPEMQQLDEHFGDLQNVIMDREIEWIQALADRLPTVQSDLKAAGEALAELDCLLAFADAVNRFDLRRPVMREKPTLKIRKGFNPLYAMCVPTGQYIDNDTVLAGGGDEDRAGMMVVTGANGSGKSAYGKQVALITYMAHIGCFVPAESADIGICDKIFTRVQTRESSSKHASAFMIDLSQVSQALRGMTERSLLILDEFGKGTANSDGAGLLAGIIAYLIKGSNPRTVVLTHHHQMFAQQFIERGSPIIYCHMTSFIDEGSKVLTYLYKLAPTLALTSNAAECALMHGIPEDVVERGRIVSEHVSKFQITKLIDAQMSDGDLDHLVQAEDLAKRFLSWNLHEDDDGVLKRLREMFHDTIESEEENELELGEGSHGVTMLERRVASEAASRAGGSVWGEGDTTMDSD